MDSYGTESPAERSAGRHFQALLAEHSDFNDERFAVRTIDGAISTINRRIPMWSRGHIDENADVPHATLRQSTAKRREWRVSIRYRAALPALGAAGRSR